MDGDNILSNLEKPDYVVVDNGESAANVPLSMELENHEVLDVEDLGGSGICIRPGTYLPAGFV